MPLHKSSLCLTPVDSINNRNKLLSNKSITASPSKPFLHSQSGKSGPVMAPPALWEPETPPPSLGPWRKGKAVKCRRRHSPRAGRVSLGCEAAMALLHHRFVSLTGDGGEGGKVPKSINQPFGFNNQDSFQLCINLLRTKKKPNFPENCCGGHVAPV